MTIKRPSFSGTSLFFTGLLLLSYSCTTGLLTSETTDSFFPNLTLKTESLPISQEFSTPLADFQTIFLDDLIEINILTNPENCLAGFYLERKIAADFFETIQQQEFFGDSLSASYLLVDDDFPFNQDLTYRLKIVNKDGTYEYSSEESIFIKKIVEDVTLIANPTRPKRYLSVTTLKSSEGKLQIFNSKGSSILSKKIDFQKGVNWSKLELQQEKNGVYFVALEIDGKRWMRKLIKFS